MKKYKSLIVLGVLTVMIICSALLFFYYISSDGNGNSTTKHIFLNQVGEYILDCKKTKLSEYAKDST